MTVSAEGRIAGGLCGVDSGVERLNKALEEESAEAFRKSKTVLVRGVEAGEEGTEESRELDEVGVEIAEEKPEEIDEHSLVESWFESDKISVTSKAGLIGVEGSDVSMDFGGLEEIIGLKIAGFRCVNPNSL